METLLKLMKLCGITGSKIMETLLKLTKLCDLMGRRAACSATFPVIIRWFLIQIAYNIGDVVNTDDVMRYNGAQAALNVTGGAPSLPPNIEGYWVYIFNPIRNIGCMIQVKV